MAAKLHILDDKIESVTRELSVGASDDDKVRMLVAELQGDGKVKLRLKGNKRTVVVDLLKVLGMEDGPVAEAGEKMTAKKRTLLEHLRGE